MILACNEKNVGGVYVKQNVQKNKEGTDFTFALFLLPKNTLWNTFHAAIKSNNENDGIFSCRSSQK